MELQEERFEIDGVGVRALVGGTAGSAVVLLHGGGTDSARLSWGPTAGTLAESHRVYVPDWPGYGESRLLRSACTQERLLERVGALLDHWGLERASLVGISMGGGAALGFALACPERVDRLLLVCSYGLSRRARLHPLAWLATHAPGVMELAWWLIRRSRRLALSALGKVLFDRAVIDRELEEEFLRSVRTPSAGVAFTQWQRSELAWRGFRNCYADRLAGLRVPTFVLHAGRDRILPFEAARSAASRIPGGRLRLVEKCGHWLPRERPDEFLRVAGEFLSEPGAP